MESLEIQVAELKQRMTFTEDRLQESMRMAEDLQAQVSQLDKKSELQDQSISSQLQALRNDWSAWLKKQDRQRWWLITTIATVIIATVGRELINILIEELSK